MQKKIAILTDSACDLSTTFLNNHKIKMIPLKICFTNKTFRDRIEITPLELYDLLKDEIPKTSLPGYDDIIKVFEELKDEGYTDVLYIGISSGLSGTYNFVKQLGEEYPHFNFYSFDTKTLSSAQGMLVSLAVKMLEQAENIKEILYKLLEARKKMLSLFVVKDITYLKKGGRIGKFAGTIGSLLKICPIVKVNDEGKYEIFSKSIGFSKSIRIMVQEVENKFSGLKVSLSVVHGLEEATAKAISAKIKRFCNVVEENISSVTAVLGVHTGPGLLGVIVRKI